MESSKHVQPDVRRGTAPDRIVAPMPPGIGALHIVDWIYGASATRAQGEGAGLLPTGGAHRPRTAWATGARAPRRSAILAPGPAGFASTGPAASHRWF